MWLTGHLKQLGDSPGTSVYVAEIMVYFKGCEDLDEWPEWGSSKIDKGSAWNVGYVAEKLLNISGETLVKRATPPLG